MTVNSWLLGTVFDGNGGKSPVHRLAQRNLIAGIVLAAVFLLAACSTSQTAPPSGSESSSGPVSPVSSAPRDAAAGFEIVSFANDDYAAGESISLDSLSGRPVVVNFWFPSCPPCVAEMPDIENVYQKHKNEVDFVGIQLVGLDTVADGQDFVTRLDVNYILGPDEDGSIVKDYRVAGFPTTVFLDSDHNVARSWTGILNEEKLEEFVVELID